MRSEIVRVARSYLDTPFRHMGRVPGKELDCAGLLICVARELCLVSHDFDVPAYTQPDGTMLKWCFRHMTPTKDKQIGDAIVVAIDKEPQHLGILADYRHGGLSIIHACNAPSCKPARVIETRLMFSRVMTFVAAFQFPGV
jgi:hypothetical protein